MLMEIKPGKNMPVDMRSLDLEAKDDGTVGPSMESQADVLMDPLEAHSLSKMDRLRDYGSKKKKGMAALPGKAKKGALALFGKGRRDPVRRGVEEDPLEDVGARRQAKAEGVIEQIHQLNTGLRTAHLRKHYLPETRAFMEKEFNNENLEFLEALDAGTPEAEIIATYIRDGAPSEINLSHAVRTVIMDGTSPLSHAKLPVIRMIGGDVWSRMRSSRAFIASVGEKL